MIKGMFLRIYTSLVLLVGRVWGLVELVLFKMDELMESFTSHFVLMEDELKPLVIREEAAMQVRSTKFFLVGKLLSRKHVNKEAFKRTMRALWRPKAKVVIAEFKPDRFVYAFNTVEERTIVLNGGPWTFDKCLLVLAKVDSLSNPARVPLVRQEFWVQVKGLPFEFMTEEMGKMIGEALGEYVVTDQSRRREHLEAF